MSINEQEKSLKAYKIDRAFLDILNLVMMDSPSVGLLPLSRFKLAIIGIFIFSLVLRFWKLTQFNVLVFDEVYYAKFANFYWLDKPFFGSHPPLGHYLIALGIWFGSLFPASPDTVNELTGSLRSTWSYRWLNALTGSFVPLLVGAIAYEWTARRRFTLIVMALAALDGLFLVESRYALNNIYLIVFGLLGHLFFFYYLNRGRGWYLTLAGIFLGCAGSVKWNGFAFLLGIYLFILVIFAQQAYYHFVNKTDAPPPLSPFQQAIAQTPITVLLADLVIFPLVTYCVIWIPHFMINPDYGFWGMQKEIWSYHRRIGNTPDVHPYCSPWYSWLVLWRPVAYYYATIHPHKLVQDVHSMANPLLLWFSSLSIFILLGTRVLQSFAKFKSAFLVNELTLYIGLNYAANLLPWLKISRCTFFYHYMAAYLFSWFALALILDSLFASKSKIERWFAGTTLGLIAISFLFWLPIFLGLPLLPQSFSLRMLFPSWI